MRRLTDAMLRLVALAMLLGMWFAAFAVFALAR